MNKCYTKLVNIGACEEYVVLKCFAQHIMDTIFTLENLYRAYRQCQKGKKNTVNALQFEMDREKNLIALCAELQSRTYEISRHIYFVVTKPTPREIFAANFRDRIVHHLLCNEIQQLFEVDFIPCSYANRIGKGTHKAVAQVRKSITASRVQGQCDVYYLQLDIESFFSSIDRAILCSLIERRLRKHMAPAWWRKEVLWLVRKIIFHDVTANYVYKGDSKKKALIPKHKSLFNKPAGKGLPIGNLTSQFFANVYLDELDQFVTKTLRVCHYVRYVDDLVCIGSDRKVLLNLRQPIDAFLRQKLGLHLHPKKVRLQSVSQGVDFLGYIIKKEYTLVRQKVVSRCKQCLRKYARIFETESYDGEKSELVARLESSIASYCGHFSHANAYRLTTEKAQKAGQIVKDSLKSVLI